MGRGKRYTNEDIAIMALRRAEGRPWKEIAEELGRTENSITIKAHRLGLDKINERNLSIVYTPPSIWDEEVECRIRILKSYLPRLEELAAKLIESGKPPDRDFSLFMQSLAALIRSLEPWQTGKERLKIIVQGSGVDAADAG